MRRRGLAALFVAVLGAIVAQATPRPMAAETGTVPSYTAFVSFVASLRPEAITRGVSSEAFDAAFAGLSPDPAIAPLTRRQPELVKPTGRYLAAQVTPGRVATGRSLLARWRPTLDAIEARSGVPAAIVVAIWGLETNYGAAPGSKDVIRSMATLGALGYRTDLYRSELLSALALLQKREASREQLRGSWAGAMGQPQFMPSSFAKYAVDGDGDGRRDIWGSVPDSLASIANFLREAGWRRGEAWGYEVRLPPRFDIGATSRAAFPAWAARGVTRADSTPLPGGGEGILYYPAGAGGPVFLVTANFEVIKTYNSSDNYVLSVGTLADRIAGREGVAAPWPTDPPISREDRIALQARLAALGYVVDDREGRISLALRDTIRAAQAKSGMTPDGNPTAALLRDLPAPPAAP